MRIGLCCTGPPPAEQPQKFSRRSRHILSFSCTTRSEKEKSTHAPSMASCTMGWQRGATKWLLVSRKRFVADPSAAATLGDQKTEDSRVGHRGSRPHSDQIGRAHV